ncbi:hypothetical protein EXE53_15395 [Halorubrum sp. SD626R]|uniref:hypothetical protein n=1 Tax=Halorubrum sp. SD626R TaxID=1419722 RepID=UPI0010F5E74C|nr:hypothetical protein [Halorubrum sp. SD626R]TKX79547.1 hypothetical protein EXE53_15395 [Halorubrum sp. SD626R]
MSSDASTADWMPVNQATGTQIGAGQRATFTFEPDAGAMRVDSVAASKYQGLTYEVRVDGDTRFGPAPIPPTDIDDMVTTHNPRMPVDQQVTVIIRNPSTVDRYVASQVRGIEQ